MLRAIPPTPAAWNGHPLAPVRVAGEPSGAGTPPAGSTGCRARWRHRLDATRMRDGLPTSSPKTARPSNLAPLNTHAHRAISHVLEPGGNRMEIAPDGIPANLAPDWETVTSDTETGERSTACDMPETETFHSHETPPLATTEFGTERSAPGTSRHATSP